MQTTVSSQGFEYGVKHFYSPNDGFAIDIIQSALNLDHNEIENLFFLGAVYINNQRCVNSLQKVTCNSTFRVHTKPRRYYVDYDWISQVVFQNEDFVILNKPSGLPSHPSVDNIIENSLTQLERTLNLKLFISHRLDTTTSGLIVYGKNQKFVREFNFQLQAKTIEKKYIALVEASGILPDRLIHYMEPSPRAPKKVTQIFTEGWDECELLIEEEKNYTIENQNTHQKSLLHNNKIDSYTIKLIKINLLTGRTHQIRAQLSEIGCPLLGDKLYGSNITWEINPHTNIQIALKSCFIEFNNNNQRMQFELQNDF